MAIRIKVDNGYINLEGVITDKPDGTYELHDIGTGRKIAVLEKVARELFESADAANYIDCQINSVEEYIAQAESELGKEAQPE